MDEYLAPELEEVLSSSKGPVPQACDDEQVPDVGFDDSDVDDLGGSIKSHEMRGFRKRWNLKRLRSPPSCAPSPSLMDDGYDGGPDFGSPGAQDSVKRQATASTDSQASVTNSFLTGMKVNTHLLP